MYQLFFNDYSSKYMIKTDKQDRQIVAFYEQNENKHTGDGDIVQSVDVFDFCNLIKDQVCTLKSNKQFLIRNRDFNNLDTS